MMLSLQNFVLVLALFSSFRVVRVISGTMLVSRGSYCTYWATNMTFSDLAGIFSGLPDLLG
jgi:hypothetical protein